MRGVRKIKGEKFSQEKIEEAITILKEEGYLEQ
jgi:SOS response regulatory protein OraA/RecX